VAPVPSTPAPPPPVAQTGTLRRSAVRTAVRQGVGAFLQHLELDDQPVFAGGRFHGFRIAALHDAAFWAGVDLKPGDVITGVNGFPIEHPDDAQRALDSLQVASELRVAYERDGHPREIVYGIVDDR
jgi:type II secretory pathway component PulC